jgi:hypothetical protein
LIAKEVVLLSTEYLKKTSNYWIRLGMASYSLDRMGLQDSSKLCRQYNGRH